MTAAKSVCLCARSGESSQKGGYYREVDSISSALADLMQRARCTKSSFLDDKAFLSGTKNEAQTGVVHVRVCLMSEAWVCEYAVYGCHVSQVHKALARSICDFNAMSKFFTLASNLT